jgi:hypothetical protein
VQEKILLLISTTPNKIQPDAAELCAADLGIMSLKKRNKRHLAMTEIMSYIQIII